MASAPKLLSLFFLFALFSIQINAREFFSKIPRENTNEKEPAVSVPNKDEQQEPRFSPETQNGYGLYGHEAETNTNTKETYEPYVTPVKFHPDEPYNMIPASKNSNTNNKDSYFYSKSAEKENLGERKFTENEWSTKENQNNNKDSYFYSKSAEESAEKENLGERRFTEKGWNTKENNNNNNKNNYYNGNNEEAVFTEKGWSTKENKNNKNNNNYYNGNNEYNKNAYGEAMFTEKGWSAKENNNNNNNNNNYYNGEKQGMSDTRFLENGKYYYDLKSENNYYPNQFENSRGFDSRNEFNENRYNNMGRYNQNQEEFGENEEEFEP